MTTSATATPAARAAFARFIDYAGLFPPATLAMAPALAEYRAAAAGPAAWMLGRFIAPASRLKELASSLDASNERIPLSVILDAPADHRKWFGAAQALLGEVAVFRAREGPLAVEALEVPLPSLMTRRDTFDATIGQCAMLAEAAKLRDLPIYVEIPRDERWGDVIGGAMSALARYRLRAKVRCGGVSAEAFPTTGELAAFVRDAAETGVPFKATAGLHHPVRHVDEPSGFMMHGFLNLLTAAALAPDAALEDLAGVLEDQRPEAFGFDAGGLSYEGRRFDEAQITSARTRFIAYGSCSFSEPVDDLIALRVLSH